MKVLGLLGVKGSGKDTMAKYLVDAFAFTRLGFADALYQQVADAYGTSVAALNKRETKESPLGFLSLSRCADIHFVEVALTKLTRSRRVVRAALQFVSTGQMPPHAPSRRVKELLNCARSPRWTLQLWGTEYRRTSKYGVDSYWLDIVAAAIDAAPSKKFVITDVRFLNEARFVDGLGGKLMRIRRPALEAKEAADRARRGTAAHPSEVELLTYVVPFEVVNKEGDPDSLLAGVGQLGLQVLAAAA